MNNSRTDAEIVNACRSVSTMLAAAQLLQLPYGTFKRKALALGCWKPNMGGKGVLGKRRYTLKEMLVSQSPVNSNHVKHRLFEAGVKAKQCESCKLVTWLDKPISLELHHKDGDGTNNVLTNLQVLCPNCHSFTDNWRKQK